MTAKVMRDKGMMKLQLVVHHPPPLPQTPLSVPLLAGRGTAEFVITSRPTELIES